MLDVSKLSAKASSSPTGTQIFKMKDHRGSWRWQSSSSLTIKPKAGVSDLPTMQHVFKRAQFLPVKKQQLHADVLQISVKTRAYLGRCVWRRAASTAHQPAEYTHTTLSVCDSLSLSLSLSLSSSFLLSLSWSLYLISSSLCLPVWWIQISGELFVSPPSSLLTNTLKTHQSWRRRRFIHTRGISTGHVPVSLTNTHSSVTGGQPTAVATPEAKREWRKKKRRGDEWEGMSSKERAHADMQREREWGHYVKEMDYSQMRCWGRAELQQVCLLTHTELTTAAQTRQTRKSKWRHRSSYTNTTHTQRHTRRAATCQQTHDLWCLRR